MQTVSALPQFSLFFFFVSPEKFTLCWTQRFFQLLCMYHLKASSPHQFLQLLRNFQEASFSLLLFLRVQGCISCYPWNKASLLCAWCCTEPIHSHPQQPLRRVHSCCRHSLMRLWVSLCSQTSKDTTQAVGWVQLELSVRGSSSHWSQGHGHPRQDVHLGTHRLTQGKTTLIKFGKQQILQKTSDLGKRGRTWQRTIEILQQYWTGIESWAEVNLFWTTVPGLLCQLLSLLAKGGKVLSWLRQLFDLRYDASHF